MISCTVSLQCLLQVGWTALHYASRKSHHGIVQDLIKVKANVNAVTEVCVNLQIRNCVLFFVYTGELNEAKVCSIQINGALKLCISINNI